MIKHLEVKEPALTPEEKQYLATLRQQETASTGRKNLRNSLFTLFRKKRVHSLNDLLREAGTCSNYRIIKPATYRFDDPVVGKVNLEKIIKLSPRELKQAKSSECRAYVDSAPPVSFVSKTIGPFDNDSEGMVHPSQDPGYGYDISLTASLEDKTHWYTIDTMDFYWNYLLFEYMVPAPSCPAYITWSVEFQLAYQRILEDADSFKIFVHPVAYSSPDGTSPAWKDLDRARIPNHPAAVNIQYMKKNFFMDSGSTEFYSFSQGYEVEAGVTSTVYFGISLDLRCEGGKVAGRALLNLTSPSASTFPDTSIHYVSWAKELVPNCYITSAICETLGKGDNCRELNLLRDFRDNYLVSVPDGKVLIEDYYRRAPGLVRAIKSNPEGDEILERIYHDYLSKCINLIEAGEKDAAVDIYREMVLNLEGQVTFGN